MRKLFGGKKWGAKQNVDESKKDEEMKPVEEKEKEQQPDPIVETPAKNEEAVYKKRSIQNKHS